MSRDEIRLKVITDAENAIQPLLAAMTPLHRLLMYKTLYAQNLRIGTVEREISVEVSKILGKS